MQLLLEMAVMVGEGIHAQAGGVIMWWRTFHHFRIGLVDVVRGEVEADLTLGGLA